MKAWQIVKATRLDVDDNPLQAVDLPTPVPLQREIVIKVSCCGVCHTEIDEIEGRALPSQLPMVPGHQVIGVVAARGSDAKRFTEGARVGVAWIFQACGHCEYCNAGLENLCTQFLATGRDRPGGYAEYMAVDERFAYAIPERITDHEAAPLLCAGAIGYRSLALTTLADGETLGFSGFGSSAHLVLKLAQYLYPHSATYVLARSEHERAFAVQLGATWAGSFDDTPPVLLNAIIDTTPAWTPIARSLLALKPGGRLVINAIRKESTDQQVLQQLRYHDHLWMEKEVKSVANITRHDVEKFLALAAAAAIKPAVELYPFAEANRALTDLKRGHSKGSKVLVL